MSKQEPAKVELKWLGGKCGLAKIREFEIPLDNPITSGGENTAPMPTEILLASLGGCFMMGMTYFAKKMRINLKKLDLKLTGVKDEDAKAPRFKQITIQVFPNVEIEDSSKLLRLSELAEKYCTVGNSLKNETKISFQIHPMNKC